MNRSHTYAKTLFVEEQRGAGVGLERTRHDVCCSRHERTVRNNVFRNRVLKKKIISSLMVQPPGREKIALFSTTRNVRTAYLCAPPLVFSTAPDQNSIFYQYRTMVPNPDQTGSYATRVFTPLRPSDTCFATGSRVRENRGKSRPRSHLLLL